LIYPAAKEKDLMRQKLGQHFTIGISDAKTSLPELVEYDQPTVLLRNNRPVGAILSIQEFNEYQTLRAAFADPSALRALVDTSDRARHLPVSKLETEEDLRAELALRSARRAQAPAAPATAAPASDNHHDPRPRVAGRG